MSKKDFENLLKKHESESEETEINWSDQKNEWLQFIKDFYNSVEQWMQPFKDEGKLKYSYKKVALTEDHIGTYDVDVMVVDFAGQKLTLEPIGTLLIGTKGRIDMEGARGRIQFILADKNSNGIKISVSTSINGEPQKEKESRKTPQWTWKIILRESRKISFEDFNEENFFDALMEVVNG